MWKRAKRTAPPVDWPALSLRTYATSVSCLPSAVADLWALLMEEHLRSRRYLDAFGLWDDWQWIG